MPEPSNPSSIVHRIRAALSRAVVNELAVSFHHADIRLMPLKGVLLQAGYYPPGKLRPHLDIDVIVPACSHPRAEALMVELGWQQRAVAHHASTWTSKRFPIAVDLHHRLFPYGRFALSAEGVFQRANEQRTLFDAPVWVPDENDLYAHLVGHFAHARQNARFLGKLRDLYYVGARLDVARTTEHLVHHGMRRSASYVLGLCPVEDEFSHAVRRSLEPHLLDTPLTWLARQVMDGGEHIWSMPVSTLLEDSLLSSGRVLARHLADWPLVRWRNQEFLGAPPGQGPPGTRL